MTRRDGEFDPTDLRQLSAAESAVTMEEVRDHMGAVCAMAAVATAAARFAWATDDVPLTGLSFEQGCLWDELVASLAVLEEFNVSEEAA